VFFFTKLIIAVEPFRKNVFQAARLLLCHCCPVFIRFNYFYNAVDTFAPSLTKRKVNKPWARMGIIWFRCKCCGERVL